MKNKLKYFKCIFFGIVFLEITSGLKAQQEYYQTVNGTIQITAVIDDTIIIAHSKKVNFILNYETATFNLYFDISTLKTDIDSLDKILLEQTGRFIEYEGKMDLTFINTKTHSRQEFNIEGYINCDNHNEIITGKGQIEHIYSGIYSCLINLSFHLTSEQLPFEIPIKGLGQNLNIEISQVILKRKNE